LTLSDHILCNATNMVPVLFGMLMTSCNF